MKQAPTIIITIISALQLQAHNANNFNLVGRFIVQVVILLTGVFRFV